MITIKDIARVAGVSHTTVSRALNGSPLIKKVTRDKIERIAAEMNYVPNYNAKSLVTKRSFTIGLFFSSIDQGTSSSFLVDAIKGISHALDENYNLTVHGIDGVRNFGNIQPQRFDGILVMSQSDEDNAFIYHVKTIGIPLVVLNRQLEDPGIMNVVANDREGVREAIDYVVSLGHQKLAIIEGKPGFKSSTERKQGFMDSLIAHRLPLHSDYFVQGDYSIESGFAAMSRLLSLPEPPSAVFCSNDDMAIGAMNACYAHKVSVPQQISLLGFDDIMFARYTNPALTTVRKPIADISELGTKMLIQLLLQPDTMPQQLFVKTSLVVRDTVTDL
ncbi:LacI family transcriptional regulator [Paenibacillus sp. FSL R7-0273]|uniref:LacI family DNA-binding transcriptional regulator n=1 Tax=Paenibacillus sp. FSL R7-0273 TaxID=1536772 RepID=UPI0004F65E74|nr:LacI family DNA-binding transcriptional regulator [Paenibacillus sp. FSL R7-0273]AIQ48434.1 LacI family transcriptional regulator [Paenibacillus sp. FSL R7-0273]OMF88419.1 LacI family transcriptional regulator [Paenibacillus sp. FSL R7-0273]